MAAGNPPPVGALDCRQLSQKDEKKKLPKTKQPLS
jgi:hypothetical protein